MLKLPEGERRFVVLPSGREVIVWGTEEDALMVVDAIRQALPPDPPPPFAAMLGGK